MKTISDLQNVELRQTLESIKDAVKLIAGDVVEIIVYGSYARGEEKEDSDVDLMVVVPDEKNTLEMKDEIRFAVYKYSLTTDFLFSVLIVPETLMKRIGGFRVFGEVEKEGMLL